MFAGVDFVWRACFASWLLPIHRCQYTVCKVDALALACGQMVNLADGKTTGPKLNGASVHLVYIQRDEMVKMVKYIYFLIFLFWVKDVTWRIAATHGRVCLRTGQGDVRNSTTNSDLIFASCAQPLSGCDAAGDFKRTASRGRRRCRNFYFHRVLLWWRFFPALRARLSFYWLLQSLHGASDGNKNTCAFMGQLLVQNLFCS
jgi:hypothetical protein